ncbi:MAG: lysophospholipid acyltransferase family protein [Acidobacteriota bacterium]
MTSREEFLHAPERSLAQKILGPLHVTGVFWYRFHRFGVRILPDALVGPVIFLFTSFFFLSLIKIRAAVASNLSSVLGPCGFWERQRRIWRTLHTFAWCLSERFERLVTDRAFEISIENEAFWEEITGSGDGFVMATAHIGNYEVGSMLPSTEEQRRVHLVREPEGNAEAQAFVQRLLDDQPGSDRYSWHFQSMNPLHALPLVHALKAGEVVAVQGDRPRTGARVVQSRLFGKEFELPAGPSTLARTAEVKILPVFVLRTGRRRYRLVFREPFSVEKTADRGADLKRGADQLADHIEWAIRSEPHQWFCFRSLWPEL